MTVLEVSLSSLIDGEIEQSNGSIDAREVAERLANDLPLAERDELVIAAIHSRVTARLANKRPPAVRKETNRSGRWEQVRENRDLLDDWYLSFTDRPSKSLMAATPEDLLESADWYAKRAEGYEARAEAYSKLARLLRRSKVSVVADLNREKVRAILNA